MRLIDADELKVQIHSRCDVCNDKDTAWCEHCCSVNDWEDYIDNAPTVDAYPFEQVQELVKLNQQFAEEIENLKRPKGKWIERGNYAYCSNCNAQEDDASPNYCWNCGARMESDV